MRSCTTYHLHFYPRPPRGGRLKRDYSLLTTMNISIHALREEGDQKPERQLVLQKHFYPRPPRGGRLK